MKTQIVSMNAPAAIGPYSQAIRIDETVYVSGQLPVDPATGAFPEGGIKEQTKQSLENVKNILNEVGMGPSNVVKTTVFIQNMSDFAEMNEVYAAFFEGCVFPARSCFEVAKLPKGALVEIEVIAR